MTAVVAFTLSSPIAQSDAPFMIGHAFRKGDVPTGQYLQVDLANVSIIQTRYWNDGSVKTATIIGRVDLVANVAKQINVTTNNVAPSSGVALTSADIQAAAPIAIVQCGSIGTASLAPLLSLPPVRTLISTKEMVECHYRSNVGTDQSLYVIFHVRLFADGRVWVRAIVGNGSLDGAEKVQKDYIPTITIGSTVVWNNGDATYYHSRGARYDITGWIGADPQVIPRHDTGYLNRTKLIPNYWKHNPSQATIDAWEAKSNYMPGANLAYAAYMPDYGYQDQIGLLPTWDALYCTSGAHPTMFKAVIAHARAINSYGLAYVDHATRNPIKISSYTNWSLDGLNAGGTGGPETKKQDNTTLLTWNGAHHPSAGYLAYILTGDYYYLESAVLNTNLTYLKVAPSYGTGFNREIPGQNRERAWAYRTLAQTCAVYPDSLSAMFGDLTSWLASLMARRVARYVTTPPPAPWLGYEDLYNSKNFSFNVKENARALNGQLTAMLSPWMHHFTTQAMGMASDIEPLNTDGMANLNAFRDYVCGAPVWILGGTGVNDYNFGYASAYDIIVRTNAVTTGIFEPVPITTIIPTNGGQIFDDTFSKPIECVSGASNISTADMAPCPIDLATFTTATLATPVTLTYNKTTNYLSGFPAGMDVSVTSGSTTTNYPSGASVPFVDEAVISFGGVQVKLNAMPETGDTFTISNSATPVAANPGTNVLTVSGPSSATAYWANLLPALSYAVDHGKAGASTSWSRFTGASNFSEQSVKANYAGIPTWGIVPRSYSQPALLFSVEDTTPTTTSGTSVRIDSSSPIPGAVAIGARGMGISGSAIASTGTHGPAPLYASLDPGDDNNEYQMLVGAIPSSLHLTISDIDGSVLATADADGVYVVPIEIIQNSASVGSSSMLFEFGTTDLVGADSTQAAVSGTGAISVTNAIDLAGAPSTQGAVSGTGAISLIAPVNLIGADSSQGAESDVGQISITPVVNLVGADSVQASTSGAGAITAAFISAHTRYTVRPENRNYTVKG